jgi:Circadian oscillating protein COP23
MELSKSILALVAFSSFVGMSQSFVAPAVAGATTSFYCDTSGPTPVTKIRTERGDETFIEWTKTFSNGYSLEERCKIVTERFQSQVGRGRMYLTSRAKVNGMPVICNSNREGGACNSRNILVTLHQGANHLEVLRKLASFQRSASNEPLSLTGSNPLNSDYVTNVDGNYYVNVNKMTGINVEGVQTDSSVSPAPTESPASNSSSGYRF